MGDPFRTEIFLVSKQTVVLRRWEIETEIYFIKRVDKGQMATVKDLVAIRPLSTRLIK